MAIVSKHWVGNICICIELNGGKKKKEREKQHWDWIKEVELIHLQDEINIWHPQISEHTYL